MDLRPTERKFQAGNLNLNNKVKPRTIEQPDTKVEPENRTCARMDSLKSLENGRLGDYFIDGDRVYYYNNDGEIVSTYPNKCTLVALRKCPDAEFANGRLVR